MSLLRFIPELPLLRRELIELANRRRTYVVRFLGAIVILSIVLLTFYRLVSQFTEMRQRSTPGMIWSPIRFDGLGGDIFRTIVPMLFHAVQLLMPALICGAITIEKERNTLGTLFVTRLTPMTIVLEKLGSRLVPMFTFLLLTFPVLAFLYSLGGVDTTLLLSTLWLLVCECIFFASIGLLCSSFFSTTATAFIWSYVLTGLLMISSTIMQYGARIPIMTPYNVWLFVFGRTDYVYSTNRSWIADLLTENINQSIPVYGSLVLGRVLVVVYASLPCMLFAAFLLLMTRYFLFRRAFVSSSSVLLRVFKRVDVFFTQLNDRTTGGVVLVRDYDSLPLFDPVAWRERSKKSLGKARYLFRILIVLEGPVLFICLSAATATTSAAFTGLRSLLYLVWGISAMILAMKASTAISSERTRETLEALLSTPLTAKEILDQKIAGLRRLMLVLSIPILSIHLTLLLMHFDIATILRSFSVSGILSILFYVCMTLATTFVVMHLVAWLSVWLGLKSSTQARSVMSAVTTIALWLAVSVFFFSPQGPAFRVAFDYVTEWTNAPTYLNTSNMEAGQVKKYRQNRAFVSTLACLTRPDGSIQANEAILVARSNPESDNYELEPFQGFSRYPDWAAMASLIVLAWQALMMILVRSWTLRRAPLLLSRYDELPASFVVEAHSHSGAAEGVI